MARERMKTTVWVFFALTMLLAAPCLALDAEQEVARIQKAYEDIRDLSGSFTQKSFIKELKRTETYKGDFYIKARKMKWDYRGDKPQTVYISDDEITIYQKKERQAFKARFERSTYGQAAIALLGGFGRIGEEFDVVAQKERLLLKPKTPMGNVVRVELALGDGPFPIESLTIIDTSSNRVDMKLRNVKINQGLKDRVFEFTPPEGVTVLQQ
jgi:outer membrane lipoprotein carrier protein